MFYFVTVLCRGIVKIVENKKPLRDYNLSYLNYQKGGRIYFWKPKNIPLSPNSENITRLIKNAELGSKYHTHSLHSSCFVCA